MVTRSWWVVVVVSTCQLANGIASSSSTAAAASSWLTVWACVSSYDVTWRRRPALRSTYRSSTRRHGGTALAAAAAGGERPDQVLVVEQRGSQHHECVVEVGHLVTSRSAAITTMRISPPSATGMTIRR